MVGVGYLCLGYKGNKKMTATHWIKIYYLLGTLLFFVWFDPAAFVAAFLMGWVLSGIVVSVVLHRKISHRQFEYRYPVFKYIGYCLLVVSGQGSPVSWAAVHRQHHSATDTADDPQSPHTVGRWRTMFSWYKVDKVNPRQLVDLLRDTEIMYIHKNTGWLFAVWCMLWWVLVPKLALAATALVPFFCSIWVGWINTQAHNGDAGKSGTRAQNIQPAVLFWGESYHQTHHLYPSQTSMGKYDLGHWLITKISKHE